MPVDQVAELLSEWRQAVGVFGRSRVLSRGVRLIGKLDADERRILARAIAEQGAPRLADQLEARSGGALRGAQLREVTDALLALEDHQLDRLSASLRDPAERSRLANTVATEMVESLASFPAPGSPVPAVASPFDEDPGRPTLGQADLGTVQLRAAEVHHIDLDVDAAAPASGPEDHAPDPDDDVTEPQPDVTAPEPDVTEPEPASLHVVPVGAADRSAPSGARETSLFDRLSQASTATQRFQLVRGGGDGPPPGDVLALLDVVPDGWQRRRIAQRWVDTQRLPTDELGPLLARFGRTSDRVFIAGSLVATGQVEPERFAGLLPDPAVDRLRARQARASAADRATTHTPGA